MFRHEIVLSAFFVILVMAGFSIFFFTRLDYIVHNDLYRYGLQFSYEWASQYWNYSTLMLGFLGVAVSVTSASIALTLLQMRTSKIGKAKFVIRLLLVVGIVVFALSIFFFTRLDNIVHNDLYRYGLQFSNEWTGQYWTYSVLVVSFLGFAVGISGMSVVLISIRTPIRILQLLPRLRAVIEIKLTRIILLHSALKSLLNTQSEFFRKIGTLTCSLRTEVFKLLRLPSRPLKRVNWKLVVGVLVTVFALSALVVGLGGMSGMWKVFRSSGKVITRGVGLYEDSAYSVPVSELGWGMVEPGSTKYIEAYLRNEGNVPIKLNLYAVNWSPLNASSYMEFGWDYDNSVVNPDDVLKVTFYLRMSDGVQGIVDFQFDVIIDTIKA